MPSPLHNFFSPDGQRTFWTGNAAHPGVTRRKRSYAEATLILLVALFLSPPSPAVPDHSLRIYFIDVEGGQATLFVTPDGQSLLIDTGWPGSNGRDADRIVAAAKDAGITKIDYVLLTHYHADHAGGVPQLAERIPIGTFMDHGESHEPDAQMTKGAYDAYQEVLASGKYRRQVANVGDLLPIKGVRAEVVASNGEVLQKPLSGAGQANPACKDFDPPVDATENHYSAGVFFTFGKVRILDLGDLTEDGEKKLMCPDNRLGHVDIYIASHHGTKTSGSAALVHAIAPFVAIVNNGAAKGGMIEALDTMRKSPGIKAVWQLHYADSSGTHNTEADFIANLQGAEAGNFLKVTVLPDGQFAIFNSRTNQSTPYDLREKGVASNVRN